MQPTCLLVLFPAKASHSARSTPLTFFSWPLYPKQPQTLPPDLSFCSCPFPGERLTYRESSLCQTNRHYYYHSHCGWGNRLSFSTEAAVYKILKPLEALPLPPVPTPPFGAHTCLPPKENNLASQAGARTAYSGPGSLQGEPFLGSEWTLIPVKLPDPATTGHRLMLLTPWPPHPCILPFGAPGGTMCWGERTFQTHLRK